MAQSTATPTEAQSALSPGTWSIDPSHSSVNFVVRHLMISRVRGRFADVSGAIEVAENVPDSKVNVIIKADSIDTREPQRDEHLRSADFFDAARFPLIEFHSTAVNPAGAGSKLSGDLTIHGVTRPVALDLEFLGVGNDPWGGTRAAFSASGEIDREAFGLTYNQALETGGVVVGKTVRIEVEVEVVRA